MPDANDALDAKIEALQDHRAGRPLSVSESTGQAADQWASYDKARRRAHIGELHEIARLRSENARLRELAYAAEKYEGQVVSEEYLGTRTDDEVTRDFTEAVAAFRIDAKITPPEDDTLRSEL